MARKSSSLLSPPVEREQQNSVDINQQLSQRRRYCFVMANAIQHGLTEQVNWRKVSSKEYPIQKHIGEGPNSAHNIDAAACKALINEASSVDQKLSQ